MCNERTSAHRADPAGQSFSPSGKACAFLVLGLCAVFFIPPFFTRRLWSPDEPRYAACAWEMRATGSYLLPRINGELYPEKPPLFFYMAALFDRIAAPNGGRIVEALAMAGLGLLLLAFLKGERWEVRLSGSLVFLTFCLSQEIGKFGVIDSVLVFFLVAAVLCGRKALTSARPLGAYLGMYALLGLGALVKGPVIIPFAALALVGLRLGLRPPAPRGKHIAGHGAGLALFALIVAAWVVPACMAGGEAYTKRLLGQIAGRVTGARKTHIQPWYYYFIAVTFTALPWTLFLPGALWRGLKRKGPLVWLLLWMLPGFVLLSAFASKRERYLALLFPAAAALLGWYLTGFRWSRPEKIAAALTAVLLIAAGVLLSAFGPAAELLPDLARRLAPGRAERFLPALRETLDRTGPFLRYVLLPLLGLGATWAGLRALRARSGGVPFLTSVCAWVICFSLAFDLVLCPALDPLKTGRDFTEAVKRFAQTGAPIALYARHYDGRFNMETGRVHFPVLGRSDDPGENKAEVARFLDRTEPAAVIAGWRRVSPENPPPPFSDRPVLVTGVLGTRTMFLIGNKAAEKLWRKPEGKD